MPPPRQEQQLPAAPCSLPPQHSLHGEALGAAWWPQGNPTGGRAGLGRLQGQGAEVQRAVEGRAGRICLGSSLFTQPGRPPRAGGSEGQTSFLGSHWRDPLGTLCRLPGHRPSPWADSQGQSHQARFGGATVGWAWGRGPPGVPVSKGHWYPALWSRMQFCIPSGFPHSTDPSLAPPPPNLRGWDTSGLCTGCWSACTLPGPQVLTHGQPLPFH